jgi:hypothetical protein
MNYKLIHSRVTDGDTAHWSIVKQSPTWFVVLRCWNSVFEDWVDSSFVYFGCPENNVALDLSEARLVMSLAYGSNILAKKFDSFQYLTTLLHRK